MNIILFIILLIIILLLILFTTQTDTETKEKFEASEFKIKDYSIIGYNGTSYEITIPPTINGIRISSINTNAFNYYAFRKVDFTGSNIYLINNKAFYQCTELTTVILNEGINFIGESAFEGCINLSSIIIPSSVNKIDKYAFQGCSKLSNITFNGSLPQIDIEAFNNIANNANINVNFDLWSLENRNSFKTYSNKNINFIDKNLIVSSDGTTITKYIGTSKEVIIPLEINGISITEIGKNAFFSNQNLEEIYWGDLNNSKSNIEKIGMYAFSNSALKSLTIPESVKYIFNEAFISCTNIKEIIFKGKYPIISINSFYIPKNIIIYHHSWSVSDINDFNRKNIEFGEPNQFTFINLDTPNAPPNIQKPPLAPITPIIPSSTTTTTKPTTTTTKPTTTAKPTTTKINRFCNNVLLNADFKSPPIVEMNNNYDINNWNYNYGMAISYDIYNYINQSNNKVATTPDYYIQYKRLISNGTIMILLYQNDNKNNYIQQGDFSRNRTQLQTNMMNVSAPIGVYKAGLYRLKATVLRFKQTTDIRDFKYNIGFYVNGININTVTNNSNIIINIKRAHDGAYLFYNKNTDIIVEGEVEVLLILPPKSIIIGQNIGIKIINKSLKSTNAIFIGNIKLVTPDSCNNHQLF